MKNKCIIILKIFGLSFSILIAAFIIKTAIIMTIGHNVIIAWLSNALFLLLGIAGFFLFGQIVLSTRKKSILLLKLMIMIRLK